MNTTITLNEKSIDIETSIIHDRESQPWMTILATHEEETFECGAWIQDDDSLHSLTNEDGDELPDEEAAAAFADSVFAKDDDDWEDPEFPGTFFDLIDIRNLIVRRVSEISAVGDMGGNY